MAVDASWKCAQHKEHPLQLQLVKYSFHCSSCGEVSRGPVYKCKTCDAALRITICVFCWAKATGHDVLEDEPQAMGSMCTLHRHPMRFIRDSKYKCSKCSEFNETYICDYPKCGYMLCKKCFRHNRTDCKANGCKSPTARGLYCMLHQYKTDVVLPKSRQRVDVMLEIVATEDSYCRSLQNAVHIMRRFVNLIELKQTLLTTEQIEQIFRNLADVCKLSESMCQGFQHLKDYGLLFDHIASTFLHFVELLYDPYLEYLKVHEQGMECLAEARTKIKQLKYFLAEGNGELDLESILIMPLQRLPRYSLLFGELVKATPQNSPVYRDVCDCKTRVDRITSDINTMLQRRHKEQTLTELAQQFDGLPIQLASGDRHLLKRGLLRRREMETGVAVALARSPRQASHRGKPKFREIYVFLFNDILVYAGTQSKNRYRFKNSFPVCDIEVDAISVFNSGGAPLASTRSTFIGGPGTEGIGSFTDALGPLTETKSQSDKGIDYAFFIKIGDVDYSMFACESEDERREWLTQLNIAIAESKSTLRPASNSLVLVSPESMVSPPTSTAVHAIAQPSGDSAVVVSDFSVIARQPVLATTIRT